MIINNRWNTQASDNGYCYLAEAIVVQAVKDYREARRRFCKNPADRQAGLKMRDTEHFFKSQWYEELINIDGKTLLKKLEEEIA